MKNEKREKKPAFESSEDPKRRQLTIEELEERIAPSVVDKKCPVPPPYPPGADYGLVRRDNLRW